MSRQVGIVTDTVSCLPSDRVRDLGIAIVPVHVLLDDEDYLDGELPPAELYERAAHADSAGTATPPPGEFLRVYEECLAAGVRGVMALTVSGALSAVHNAASLAARRASGPVEVLDTRTVASAQGLIVRRLAEEAMAGASLGDLTGRFEEVRARVGLVAMVPDLDHLARGGRVPRVVGSLGARLELKPLIRLGDDGQAHPTGVVRSFDKGIQRMIDEAISVAVPTSRLVVMHVLAEDRADQVAAALEARLPDADIEIAEFTAVMGLHTGPGLVGIAWEGGTDGHPPR